MVINAVIQLGSTANRPVQSHDGGHCAVYLLCGFLLVHFDVASRVGADEDVVHVPAQDGMPTVSNFLLQHQLHQFLGGWRHILEALSEGNHSEAHALQVLHHLHGTPSVKGDLTDVVPFSQLFNEVLNVAVVNHVALGGLEDALPFPDIVGITRSVTLSSGIQK